MGLATTLGVATVFALIAFLTYRELASASLSSYPQLTARFFNVGILPMIMAFAVIVVVEIAEVLA